MMGRRLGDWSALGAVVLLVGCGGRSDGNDNSTRSFHPEGDAGSSDETGSDDVTSSEAPTSNDGDTDDADGGMTMGAEPSDRTEPGDDADTEADTDGDPPEPESELTETGESTDEDPSCAGSDCESETPPGPLWLFSRADEGRLLNVRNPSERIGGIEATISGPDSPTPWTRDGRYVAELRGSELSLIELAESATRLPVVEVPNHTTFLRWVSNTRLLLGGGTADGPLLSLVDVDGSVTPLADTVENAIVVTHTASPDGSRLLYSTPSTTSGSFFLYVVSNDASPPIPQLLSELGPSPILSATWSRDSRWLAFGISGEPDNGIYLWEAGSTTPPRRVSPTGYGYTPFISFNDDASLLSMFLNDSERSGSFVVATATGELTLELSEFFDAPPYLSPSMWATPTGILYERDGGWYQDVSTSTSSPIAVPGYMYNCPIAWLDETSFVYSRCADTGELSLARIANDALEVEPLTTRSFFYVRVLGDGRCLMGVDADGMHFADLSSTRDLASVEFPNPVVLPLPDASGVAWAGANTIHWLDLDECLPSGNATLLDAQTSVINELHWLDQFAY